jgi:hypothetical protein
VFIYDPKHGLGQGELVFEPIRFPGFQANPIFEWQVPKNAGSQTETHGVVERHIGNVDDRGQK